MKARFRGKTWVFALAGLALIAPAGMYGWGQLRTWSALKKVEKDWHELRKGIYAYGMDRCGLYFPPDTSVRRRTSPKAQLTWELSTGFLRKLGPADSPGEFYGPLTTPIAYTSSIPNDPFRPGHFYDYTCWNFHDKVPTFYIMHSPGPDRVDDLPLAKFRDEFGRYLESRRGGHADREDLGVLMAMTLPFLYDPTNGLRSRGDLFALDEGHYVYSSFKRDELWTNVPLPALPITGKPPEIGNWQPGSEMPKPTTLAESMRRTALRHVPAKFESIGRDMGLIIRNYRNDAEMRYVALAPVQNRLGVGFDEFFRHPRALTRSEQQYLASWKGATPIWWKLMDPPAFADLSNSTYFFPAECLYTLLPYYGKSQLLLASDDAANSQTQPALNRVIVLDRLIDEFEREALSPDPFQQRVHTELHRLCRELEESIRKGQSTPAADPNPQAPLAPR